MFTEPAGGERTLGSARASNGTAKRTATAILRSVCGPNPHEQPRTRANSVPRGSAFSGVVARVRLPSRIGKESGRQVRVGFPKPFWRPLRSFCGPSSECMSSSTRVCRAGCAELSVCIAGPRTDVAPPLTLRARRFGGCAFGATGGFGGSSCFRALDPTRTFRPSRAFPRPGAPGPMGCTNRWGSGDRYTLVVEDGRYLQTAAQRSDVVSDGRESGISDALELGDIRL